VQEMFYPVPRSSSSPSARPSAQSTVGNSQVTVDVYNGGTTPGLAGQVSAALVKDGYTAGKIANATSQLNTTEVLYGAGTSAYASRIASQFAVTATASSTVAAGHVEILLSTGAPVPGSAASSSSSSSSSPSSSPSSSSSSSVTPVPTTGPEGGAVNAQNGIPCVN